MTTSSTINCKSYYVCNSDNFNLFCAAALTGIMNMRKLPPPEVAAKHAADTAEAMMAEFQKRRAAL